MPYVRVRLDWPLDTHVRTLGQRRVMFRKSGAEAVSDAELAQIVEKYGHALEPVEEVKPGVWKRIKPDVLDLDAAADNEPGEPPAAGTRRGRTKQR